MKNFARQHSIMTLFKHFYGGKVAPVLLLMLAFFQISYSQTPGKSETLEYINKKLSGSCVIEINKGNIIANYYSADGKHIREDKVFSGALDTAVTYDTEEQLLSIKCLGIEGDCVTRNLYVQKVRRQYARISFVVKDSSKVEELKKSIKHLIRTLSEPKYKDEISFD